MHDLVGTKVTYVRPVVTVPSKTKTDDKGNPVVTNAEYQLVKTDGIILGVTAVPAPADGSLAPPPNLTIAFAHPEQLHHLGGSGWRDAFERVVDVRPATDAVVQAGKLVGFYYHDIVDKYQVACKEKAAGDKKTAKAGPGPSSSTPAKS